MLSQVQKLVERNVGNNYKVLKYDRVQDDSNGKSLNYYTVKLKDVHTGEIMHTRVKCHGFSISSVDMYLNIGAMSLNSSLASVNGRSIKTAKAKAWAKEFNACLMPYKEKLLYLRDMFNPKKHVLEIDYTFLIPKLVTKDGAVRKNYLDRCNITKAPTDIIASFIGIDDAIICNGFIRKKKSFDDNPHMRIQLRLADINTLGAPDSAKWTNTFKH